MLLEEITTKVVDDSAIAVSNFMTFKGSSNSNEYRRLWKAMKRMTIASGFPVIKPLSKSEADSYLAQDENVCLLCGWTGQLLGSHIVQRHKISTYNYSNAYNLPLSAGLACPSLKAKMMENAKSNEALIAAREALGGENTRLALEASKVAFLARKGEKTYHSTSSAINIKNAKPKPKYTQKDYLSVLSLMVANDMTLTEVVSSFEVPKETAFYDWTRACKSNLAAYQTAVESLSFKAQARCQSLDDRFVRTISVLLESGMSLAEASDKLGVSEMSAWHRLNGGRGVVNE